MLLLTPLGPKPPAASDIEAKHIFARSPWWERPFNVLDLDIVSSIAFRQGISFDLAQPIRQSLSQEVNFSITMAA